MNAPSPPSATTWRPTHLPTHSFHALAPGPKLLVLGAVHGNEVCGAKAITQLLEDINQSRLTIERGTVTFVPVTNPLAYQLKQRTGDRNLNRNMAPSAIPQDFEDRIANVLCPLLDAHDVLLDLHSFHTGGAPFVMIGPQNNSGTLEPFSQAEAEMQLALCTGAPRIVEGWLDTYARGVSRRAAAPSAAGSARAQTLVTNPNYGVGTTEYMRSRGGYGVTLECGQHDDPLAVEVARRAILQTLALLNMVPLSLEATSTEREILRLVDVTDREHADDRFAREWRSFDAVTAGELIGTRHSGVEVKAPHDGFVVFPNPRAEPGQEWFYMARRRT
ncbi:MAG: succinylglutamate desuccinylase/aspartoacylase family protein [Pseudomonadota bacterium]|uniref:succinylglutamate desuccinylase/aspartoacylase family protein n=1 Tax=Polaromonas sp. TaxID=1869339 RepID=UPI0017A4197C|nr:succinylglutamate desuccinylase/aspartoacylase family protein [Polaromonas sp.]MBA3592786.1 succinylglutamate desuccinylase/aspartoacylase family protein [Polaromonas sp.]MDQ3271827.1 succinylglutamate desuccinylase/aspartoacylase family protein [Pseudomonadota bacterium]